MSYNQLPPPPPDRVGGPYGGPQLAGPGGAYGPAATPVGQPIPGQLPLDLGMAKPRSVTGIQTILWLFAVLAAGADLFSALSMAESLNPLGVISLIYAIYATIQAVVTPIQITRGKRWAWVWAVVSAVLGIAIALTTTMFGMSVIEYTTLPVIVGIAIGLLYTVLLVLLVSKSARTWILMHRVQRGEVPVQGTPGPGMVLMARQVAPERLQAKPGSVTVVQLALWVLALLPLVWVWVGLRWAQVDFADGLESWETASSAFDLFMETDLMLLGVLGVVAFAVIGTLAVISAVSLQRGRFWTRVYTPIWVGLAAVAGAMWVIAANIQVMDLDGDPNKDELFAVAMTALVAGIVFTVLALIAFIMVFLRGVRSWAPGAQMTMVYMQPGPGYAPQQPVQQAGQPLPQAGPQYPVPNQAPAPPAPMPVGPATPPPNRAPAGPQRYPLGHCPVHRHHQCQCPVPQQFAGGRG
ncbi:hypothetical protein [Glycomyces rhizosphaerae]|uniref:Uncharacterized protein n=1 Tax=Glycomyces rhizosphaerae TaxID=2054422 RepID=A0ABV7Q607_9ACTN